jgi:DNA-binding NarL/FixJ family response regulator
VTRPVGRVLVAATYPAVRSGIRVLLEDAGFDVSIEAADAEAAAAAALRERPQLCAIHAGLRGGAIEAVAKIKLRVPATGVVLIAPKPDLDELIDALRAGASGYVVETAGADGIARAFHSVGRGDPALPAELLAALAEELRARGLRRRVMVAGRGTVDLTRRQSEALELLRQGFTTIEIATRLRISPVTVRRHLGIAMEKLSADDRAAAVRALEQSDR